LPYKNRVEELYDMVLGFAERVVTARIDDDINMQEMLGSIIATIDEIEENDKSVYNTGYRAGYRASTIMHLGGACDVCGNEIYDQLEIEHIDGKGLVSKDGRGPADWKNLGVLRVLCGENSVNKCHSKTPNYKRPRGQR
jgi:hypothetical protein